MVKIDRGKPSFVASFASVEKSQWMELFSLKSAYLRNQVDVSAKRVIEAAAEAPDVYEALGFQSAEQMITEGYDLDIREVEHARKWLELSKADAPYREVVSRAEKAAITAEAVRSIKAEKPEATQQQIADEVGISQQRAAQILNTNEKGNLPNSLVPETIEQESVRRGISERCVKRERQLQRDHPEISERFKAGEFKSLNAACIEAGIVHRKVGVPVNDVAAVATILLKHYTKHELIEAIQLSALR